MALRRDQITEITRAVALPVKEAEKFRRRLPTGFPILLFMESREPVRPVLRFLWEKYRYRTSTAVSLASDLKDWWAFVSEGGLRWDEAARSDIEYYRDVMSQTVSPKTHRPYRPATIRRRVGSVEIFYEWAIGKGLVAPHLHSDTMVPPRTVGKDDCVRAMSGPQVAKVFAALGTLPSEVRKNQQRSRDRLMGEISLNVGLRRAEVAALEASQIRSMHPDESMPNGVCLLVIEKTKGLVKRTIEFPNWLVLELLAYDRTERAAAELASGSSQSALFLNHAEARRCPGLRVSNDTIDHVFHKAILSAGLVTQVVCRNPRDGIQYERAESMFTFHSLRHSFAIWMYYAELAAGIHEPWKRVQALLGHANLITTLEIYLRPCAAFEGQVSDAVRNHFATIRNG